MCLAVYRNGKDGLLHQHGFRIAHNADEARGYALSQWDEKEPKPDIIEVWEMPVVYVPQP